MWATQLDMTSRPPTTASAVETRDTLKQSRYNMHKQHKIFTTTLCMRIQHRALKFLLDEIRTCQSRAYLVLLLANVLVSCLIKTAASLADEWPFNVGSALHEVVEVCYTA